MFICEFISFTVWSSFTGRIISLSRIFRLLDPRPSRSIPLPYPRQAIKILSATLLKNYGTLLVRVLVSLLVRSPLSLAPINYECVALSPFLFTSLPRRIASLSLPLCVSSLTMLVALLHPPFDFSSGLLSARFPLPLPTPLIPLHSVVCFCPVLSSFAHSFVYTSSYRSESFLYPCYSLSLSCYVFPCLSFFIHLLLVSPALFLSHSHSFVSRFPLCLASLVHLILTYTDSILYLLVPFLLQSFFFLVFMFNLSLASS